ncbi:MAG TPA: hypothetical protein VHS28_02530, partial [Chloroflexota bacterium]|nr:hypothetical protein [Chloroflexota bacterium]
MSLWLTMLLLLASPFNLQNGDFRAQQDGKPIGWQTGGTCRLIPNGGKDGMPAMEIESGGKDRSYAQQVLSFA